NADIPFAKSLVDYIFRWLGMRFIPGYREANSPARLPVSNDEDATVKEDRSWQNLDRSSNRFLGEANDPRSTGPRLADTGAGSRREPLSRSLPDAREKTDDHASSRVHTNGGSSARSSHTTVIAAQTTIERTSDGLFMSEQATRFTAESASLDMANAALMGD